MPDGPELTIDIDEFISWLQPADVLLYDSLRPASHIIKFAENRPINHAALYAGQAVFLHATTHEPGYPVVQRASLHDRLATRRDRTVTALRHHPTGSIDVRRILAVAEEMVAQPRSYAFVDLLSLVVPTFLRSYRNILSSGGPLGSGVSSVLAFLSTGFLTELEEGVAANGEQLGDSGAWTLTCSEFVFRAYDEAAVGSITVTEPLARWGQRMVTRGSLEVPGPFDFHSSLSSLEPDDHHGQEELPVIVRGLGSKRELAQLLGRSVRAIAGQARRNAFHQKYGPHLPEESAPLADVVTPRDLWSSPSFCVACVFHRPAASEEIDLDQSGH